MGLVLEEGDCNCEAGSRFCRSSWVCLGVSSAAKVYRGYFYMGCFQGQTMKRHVIWSNDCKFIRSIVAAGGFLSASAKQALAGRALVIHKTDPVTGQKRFTGVKKRLKDSQSLVCLTMGLDMHRNVVGWT